MQTRRWMNPTLPQTLHIAVILLYIDAFFGVLYGTFRSPMGAVIVVGSAVAGFGIANEKKAAYWLGVVVSAIYPAYLVLVLLNDGFDQLLSIGFIFSAIFPVAQLLLLVHPMSRDYQRIWFR
jgi:hypothetical protein